MQTIKYNLNKSIAMNQNEHFVITINRQFGTGGHEVGAEIAKRLGVKLLDKQLLTAVAKELSADDTAIQRLQLRNPSWWDDFTQFYRHYMAENEYHISDRDSLSRQFFEAQAAIIRRIAEQESCVIIGRCAFDIFKDYKNALKIFIHSRMETRIRRIVQRYGVSESDAKLMIVDNDYTRELYTKTFTGSEWYDARNYDLCLDVGKFGVNGAVDYIMKLISDE